MSLPLEQFIERLIASSLMSSAELSTFQASFATDQRPSDSETLAASLVKAGKLTKYQAQAVYQGRIKGLVLGEYVILEKIGQGGVGVVFRAMHRKRKRMAAVKVLSIAAMNSPDAVSRFRQEVEAASKLSHPNIVAAYDAGEQHGTHYLVMEFVEGRDLSSIVKEHGTLSIHQAIDCVLQVARALQYAHEQGIIHRDIKPSNLLLDNHGKIKILDMGLARCMNNEGTSDGQERLTTTGETMGTWDYMAPEQAIDSRQADARSDIYSLGCTFYRLVTGSLPYPADTTTKAFLMHREAPIPSLCRARPGISAALDGTFRKMLAKQPVDRFQAMTEVIAELEACLGRPDVPTSPNGLPTEVFNPLICEELYFPPEPSAVLANVSSGGTFRPIWLLGRRLKARLRNPKVLLAVVAGVMALLLAITFWASFRHGSPAPKIAERPAQRRPATSGPPTPVIVPLDGARARQHQQAWAQRLRMPVEQTNSIGMKLVLIPPGEFDMGSTPEEIAAEIAAAKENNQTPHSLDSIAGEGPRHHVKITKPFCLGMYPVTQTEYQQLMRTNPSGIVAEPMDISMFDPPLSDAEAKARKSIPKHLVSNDTSRHPVDTVSWDDCTEFCRRLTALPVEQAAKRVYRLPTEAEWEYACRAGTTTRWYCGNSEVNLQKFAWIGKEAGGTTHPVGQKQPNAWGLFDMHGNVGQWCADCFKSDYYGQSPLHDPAGPPNGAHVVRGGAWNLPASRCRSSSRGHDLANIRLPTHGLRLVCEIASHGP